MRLLALALLLCVGGLVSATPIISENEDVGALTSGDGDATAVTSEEVDTGTATSGDGDATAVTSGEDESGTAAQTNTGSGDDAMADGDVTGGGDADVSSGGSADVTGTSSEEANEGSEDSTESEGADSADTGDGRRRRRRDHAGDEEGSGGDAVADGDVSGGGDGDVSGEGSADVTETTGEEASEGSEDSAESGIGDSGDTGDSERRKRRDAADEEGSGADGDSVDGGDKGNKGSSQGAGQGSSQGSSQGVPKGVFVPPVLGEDTESAVIKKGVIHESKEEQTGTNEHGGKTEAEVQQEEEETEELRKYLKARKKDKKLPPPDNIDFPDIDVNKIMKEEGQSLEDKGSKGGKQTEGGRSARRKRFSQANGEWPQAIIPYVFTSQISEDAKPGILVAMHAYERSTCIRFKEKTDSTSADFKLGHEGFLSFVSASGCWATQGNTRSPKGQSVSCCSWGVCVHELGHAMGVWHEHQSPLRQGLLSVIWEGVDPNFARWFAKLEDSSSIIVDGYDSQSIMSYHPWMFAKKGMKTLKSLFPREIRFGENTYYLFREVSKTHKCKELFCADETLDCVNDGFMTLVRGKCACNCPSGLDPKTGCAQIEKKVAAPSKWPQGQYALDLPVGAECPAGFQKGSRKHFSGPGTWRNGNHVGSEIGWFFIKNDFCVKTDTAGEGQWGRGKYCILRSGGKCPAGFTDGSVTWDDNPSKGENEKEGKLPDGEFGEDTTLQFCCRRDDFEDAALELPTTTPLVLYMVDYWQGCQEIKGMAATKEYYAFKHAGTGVAAVKGFVPQIGQWWNSFYINYCYYQPIDKECGGIIELSAGKPSAVITSPGFDSAGYKSNLQCDWLVKGPANSTLLLEFEEFQVEQKGGSCADSLEVRLDRLGQKGEHFCGEGGIERTFRTMHETLMLTLHTNGEVSKKGFKAKVKVVLPEDHCYRLEDQGLTYRGTVNVTRDFKACVEWRLVTQCENNLWNDGDNSLERNYCRTPSGDLRPWCYTQIENCERSYCDVCGLEKPFDSLDDCGALKTAGFCKGDKREALDGCALTCAGDLGLPIKAGKVADVKCDAPKPPPDAKVTSSGSGPFKVGDQVTLKCQDSDQTFTLTCLTSGQWTPAGFVCGGCPYGWVARGGDCYQFTATEMKGLEARQFCQAAGATLPMPRSAQDIDVIDSIRPTGTKVWLGATDEKAEKTWLFLDGTPADSLPWKTGEPNNWYNQDCAVLQGDKGVEDVYCDSKWAMASVICSRPFAEIKECVDRRADCLELLELSPRMCLDHAAFVGLNCRFSCGLCQPDSTPRCKVPAAGANMRLLTEAVSLGRGQLAQYACDEGYVVTQGTLNRACAKSGTLTGGPPTCSQADKSVTSVDPGNLIDRELTGKEGAVYTGNNDDFRVTRAGKVVAWHFYSQAARPMAFLVFRPRAQLPANMLEFVGVNKFTTKPDRVNHVWHVPEAQQITVANGDLVGVWYGPGEGGVPYDNVDADTHPGASGVMSTVEAVKDLSLLTRGNPVPFSPDTSAKVFSFRAVIGPVSGSGPRDLTKFESEEFQDQHAVLATKVPEIEDTNAETTPAP